MTSWEILLGGESVQELDARLRAKLPPPLRRVEKNYTPLPEPLVQAVKKAPSWRTANIAKARAARLQQLKEKKDAQAGR